MIQLNRVVVHSLAGVIAVAAKLAGVFQATYVDVALLLGSAYVSAAVFAALYRWRARSGRRLTLSGYWLAWDALIITWAVHISGGAASPWFPWYLANISAAAFVAGRRGAYTFGIVDLLAYLALLFVRGDVTGIESLYRPLAQMAFLYGASFFFLRGVFVLQDQRRRLREAQRGEQRRMEELTRLTEELDARSADLERANIELLNANVLKDQFLANMSHELRTPLNSIMGFSELLLSRLEDDLDQRYLRFLGNIQSAGQHLLGLINDILDLAKIEAGRMELQPAPIHLHELVDGVCKLLVPGAAERRVRIETDVPQDLPGLEADPARVKQILFSLMSNAVKFSSEQQVVTVRGRALGAEQSPLARPSLEIAVIDDGIGIDPREQQRIFDEFHQVDGTASRKYEGAGLGLALVSRFVQLHKGLVKVDSAPGQGSTFTVVLPLAFAGDGEVLTAAERLTVLVESQCRVLVVEDDPVAYDMIRQHLAPTQYIPIRARNGQEAMELVELVQPEAIILDIVLPGMDGWEVLKRLKAEQSTESIPVIVVSVVDNRELGLALGADDVLSKPVDGGVLCQRLRELSLGAELRQPHTVLLIDDDPLVHEMVTGQLVRRGYEVLHAFNGADGIRIAREARPEVVVLDLMMEAIDGFEVAATLKDSRETSALPIVVLTAKDLREADRQRLRGRIEALLQKDGNQQALLVTLDAVVAGQMRNGDAQTSTTQCDQNGRNDDVGQGGCA